MKLQRCPRCYKASCCGDRRASIQTTGRGNTRDARILANQTSDPEEAVRGHVKSALPAERHSYSPAALKERKEELALLAQHLVTQLAGKHDRLQPVPCFISLQFHGWPETYESRAM